MSSFAEDRYIDPKNAMFGFLLAIMVFTVSYYADPLVFNYDNDIFADWEFESPIQLSSAMESHIEDLIQIRVRVGVIQSTISGDNVLFTIQKTPIFVGNVFGLKIYRNLENRVVGDLINFTDVGLSINSWILSKDVCCNTQEYIEFTQHNIISGLQNAFSNDFASIDQYSEILENKTGIINELELRNGEFYWEIVHIYRDTNYIKIGVFGDTIVVERDKLDSLRYDEDGFGVTFERDNNYRSTFTGIFNSEPMENYENEINRILGSLNR